MEQKKKIRLLLEMRPALDGYAGIPQETRLLFRSLCRLGRFDVQGMIQTSMKFLSGGRLGKDSPGAVDENSHHEINGHAKMVLSISEVPSRTRFNNISLYFRRRRDAFTLFVDGLIFKRKSIGLAFFNAHGFEEFFWRLLFEKSLPASDFDLVTRRVFRVCAVPWNVLQTSGLIAKKVLGSVAYPRLNTKDVDVFIAQTPFPARMSQGTALVVRYHDAFPIFMPHLFANRTRHNAVHYNALVSNVRDGAYFACVSDQTRVDLLRVFPELAGRAETIHNMVSPTFREGRACVAHAVAIVNATAHDFCKRIDDPDFRYVLMVSTVEPRKNHTLALAALEVFRARVDTSLHLVLVGAIGWDAEPIMKCVRAAAASGSAFLLSNVSAADLCVLYQNASATICPSTAEGFDYSGVESMRCATAVLASDIPVHREVYDDAAVYFDAHSADSLVDAMKKLLAPDSDDRLVSTLIDRGRMVSSRYLPEALEARWDVFLDRVVRREIFLDGWDDEVGAASGPVA